VTQWGVNRGAVFVDDEDRTHSMSLLAETAATGALVIHAYVLMSNHVHLLVSSGELGSISSGLRWLGQCCVQAFNRRHRRSGPLWEGRFKFCLGDSDAYLLAVYWYIELNPVRAAMVDAPNRYRSSSAHGNLGSLVDPVLTPHDCFMALGLDEPARGDAYREWLEEAIRDEEPAAIRQHLAQERALGSPLFQQMVEKTLERPVSLRARGRPARSRWCRTRSSSMRSQCGRR